jgi:hypothetical protein
MKVALVQLVSLSPYSPSRRVPEREKKEAWDAYEERIWQDRVHWTAEGQAFMPPMGFKRSLETAARFLRMRIPGKDKSEFGKHFLSGILVPRGIVLPIDREHLEHEKLYLSSSGKKGEMNVLKWEPLIREWSGELEYYVLDDVITPEVFETHLREAGNFIGMGRFRPEKGGFYGRYEVKKVVWK